MYQSLYRKYRPSTFDEVVGQEVPVKILKNAIKNNRIAHAYLFAGIRGTGKTSIAKIFAKTINCVEPKNMLPCGECVVCTQKNNTDIVEIDAGDTYAYDIAANTTKRERELKAADRIFNILPKDQAQWMRQLWDEFEEGKTPEAKFALTLDKVQPLMLNDATDGRAWREHNVHCDSVYKRNKNTGDGTKVLWEYAKELIERNIEKKNLRSGDV